jgi:riboflavin kinase/FMN adenylyltransferase
MWRTVSDVSELAQDAPVMFALSGFDGVHREHQRLIHRARELADAAGAALVLATCWPPLPSDTAGAPPYLLTTREERAGLLRALAVDATLLDLTLPPAAAGKLPDTMAAHLARHPHVAGIVAATDLAARLTELRATCVPALPDVYAVDMREDNQPSTAVRIRDLLERGDVAMAERLLARPYVVSGVVIEGDKRGRELGFPTANLRVDPVKLIPANGIYVVRARVDGEPGTEYGGAASIGVRPTFGVGKPRLVEVHVLDAQPNLYGRTVVVEFVARLRAEERFDGVEALVAQMRADVAQARAVLAAVPAPR